MSLLLSLLGWTKLPPWVIELAVVVLVAGGVWLYHEHVVSKLIDAGRSTQRLEDQKALDRLRQDVAAKQEVVQANADKAHQQYENEHADLIAYRITHPDRAPDKLCINAPYGGGRGLQSGSGATAGTAGTATASPILSTLPGSDPLIRPDRRGLLGALAALCENTSSQVREFQRR